jgi:hypothetical protein
MKKEKESFDIRKLNFLPDIINNISAKLIKGESIILKIKDTSETISLGLLEIFTIIKDTYNNIKNKIILEMLEYFDGNPDKIKYLLQKINIYMLGISLIQILHNSGNIYNENNLLKLLVEIIGMCCIIIFEKDDKIYIIDYNIDEIKQKYDELCEFIKLDQIKNLETTNINIH